MTREEAIDRLRKISEKIPIRTNGDDLVAITMAIKALSQEPTVTSTDEPMTMIYPTIICDDAISRREALKCINDTWGDYFILNELFERIDKLPSVTQKSIECEDAISQIKERIAYYENRKPKDGYDGVSYGKTEDGGGELKNPRTVEYERYSNRQIGLEEALEIIQNRSVTPKSGKWIDDEFGSKCSCCGIHTHLDKFDKPMKFKYCSMCGAKMEGEDKE